VKPATSEYSFSLQKKSSLRYVYDDENNYVTIRRLAVGGATVLLLASEVEPDGAR
jgi:hypothetical protein